MARSESPSISVSHRGSRTGETDRTVVWVRGDHDIATKVSLAVAIARAARVDDDDADLLLDLSGVTFMDASIIGVIVGSANRLRSRSQSLAVRAPSPRAVRVLDLCGFTDLAHPAPLAVVHPSGPAAALSTWIEVPPAAPSEHRDGADVRDAPHPEAGEPARSMSATIDAEADRGGP